MGFDAVDANSSDLLQSDFDFVPLLESGRNRGKWVVYLPEGKDYELFMSLAKSIIPQALDECHPAVRRMDTVILFNKDDIVSTTESGNVVVFHGKALIDRPNRAQVILISKPSMQPPNNVEYAGKHIQALKVTLHELFENNKRYLDSLKGQEEHYPIDDNYKHRETEVTSDQLALIQLNKHFSRQGNIYSLDDRGYVKLARR